MTYPSNHSKFEGKTAEEWSIEFKALSRYVDAVVRELDLPAASDAFTGLESIRRAHRPRTGTQTVTLGHPYRLQTTSSSGAWIAATMVA